MDFSITMAGGDELMKKLNSLEPKVGRKLLRTGLKNALAPIRAAAIMNALNIVGGEMGALISENIVSGPWKKQRSGGYGAGVHMRGKMPVFVHVTKIGVREYIPAAIEYGHAGPFTAGSDGKTKDVPAIPFFRPAIDAQKDKALAIAAAEIREELEKA